MKTNPIKTKLIAILFAITGMNLVAQTGYGEIRGVIKNTEREAVPYATVKIMQGNVLVGGTQTDMEGRYKYKPLTPGTYEMVIIEPGHQTQPINKIMVTPNEATYIDVKLTANTFTEVVVTAKPIEYEKSGADQKMYSMVTIDSKDLLQNASMTRGDIKSIMSNYTSNAIEVNGEVHVRGSRGNASAYYIDGVRTLGPNTIPGLAIENVTFFSGGVPAMYGDMTSGAVIVTTKSYFSGLREKNIRDNEYRERQALKKAEAKEKLELENRKKEIEAEKAKPE